MNKPEKIKKIKISIYLRESTYNKLLEFMKANEQDNISFTIDNELANRFNYLIEAKEKAKKELEKEAKEKAKKNKTPEEQEEEVFDNMYKNK